MGTSNIFWKKMHLAFLGLSIVLLGLIGFLLASNYRSQIQQQEYSLENMREAAHRQQEAIAYCLAERRKDISHLASNDALFTYFANKDLGMSMAYGLQASLLGMSQAFDQVIMGPRLDGQRIYHGILFVDTDGSPLVESAFMGGDGIPLLPWKGFLTPQKTGPFVLIYRHQGSPRVMVSMPYFFRDHYSGQIIALLSPHTLYHLTGSQGANPLYITYVGDEQGYIPKPGDSPTPANDPSMPFLGALRPGEIQGFEAATQAGDPEKMLAIWIPVAESPLSLFVISPASKVLGRAAPWSLPVTMGIMVILVLGGMAIVFRIATRTLILDARVEEITKSKGEIEEKTRQLEGEIRERIRVEEALRTESLVNEALARLPTTMIISNSIEEISIAILDYARQLTASPIGYVGYIDPPTGYLVSPTLTRDIWNVCEIPERDVVFKNFAGLWGWVLNNKKSLMTNSPEADSRRSGLPKGHLPIQRFLSVPALIEDTLLGQISLANSERDYTQEDLALLESLAALYAIAIQRRRNEDLLLKANVELERRVAERTSELSEANTLLKQEIQEQIRTEETLRREQGLITRIMETSPAGIVLVDRNGLITFANTQAERVLGLSRDVITHMIYNAPEWRITDLNGDPFLQEDLPFRRIMKTGRPLHNVRHAIQWPSGRRILLSVNGAPLFDERGDFDGAVAAVEDITEQVQAAEALKESEEKYRDLVENIPDVIYSMDDQGVITYISPMVRPLSGYTSSDIVGRSFDSFIHPEDLPAVAEAVHRILMGGRERIEFRIVTKAGEILWIQATGQQSRKGGQMVGVRGVMTNITEQMLAHQALTASEEKMRLVIEASPIGIGIHQGGRWVYVNPAFLKMFGLDALSQVAGAGVEFLFALEERDSAKQRLLSITTGTDVHLSFEAQGLRKNGERFDTVVWQSPVQYRRAPAVFSLILDNSSEKALRRQLLQAQKMEAIGTLAGGIAHDFRNLLQVVLGYSDLMLFNKKQEDPGHRELQEIRRAAAKAAELTHQLLTFSRKVETKSLPLNLNHQVKHVHEMLRRTIPRMIEIDLHLAPDLKTIKADPGQMEQILMNLAVNARDAMPEGGKLLIETQNITLDTQYCRSHAGASPSDHVLLSLSDTGMGMERETLDHIFEPFFTTKEPGKGTGLGLAMVYGIVKSHGGYITVQSQPGKGTRFEIYFPVIQQYAVAETAIQQETPKRGIETVMLVDDDEVIRNVGEQMLLKFGYKVLIAPDGERALALYEKEQVDLVLLDLIMPGMGGQKCLEKILKRNKDVKVIIASGQVTEELAKELLRTGAKGVVTKPFSMNEMMKKVREVLDQ